MYTSLYSVHPYSPFFETHWFTYMDELVYPMNFTDSKRLLSKTTFRNIFWLWNINICCCRKGPLTRILERGVHICVKKHTAGEFFFDTIIIEKLAFVMTYNLQNYKLTFVNTYYTKLINKKQYNFKIFT